MGGEKDKHRNYKKRVQGSPLCSLCGALVDRKWIEKIGGIDAGFLGVYWDIDLALRLCEIGLDIIWGDSLVITEHMLDVKKCERLFKNTKRYDRVFLDSLWTREQEEGEVVPSEEVYGHYYGNVVLSKKRLKKVNFFDDKDITLFSQGIKEFQKRKWE